VPIIEPGNVMAKQSTDFTFLLKWKLVTRLGKFIVINLCFSSDKEIKLASLVKPVWHKQLCFVKCRGKLHTNTHVGIGKEGIIKTALA
jgi:hypothetical protein